VGFLALGLTRDDKRAEIRTEAPMMERLEEYGHEPAVQQNSARSVAGIAE
jgi:hypothetical protein